MNIKNADTELFSFIYLKKGRIKKRFRSRCQLYEIVSATNASPELNKNLILSESHQHYRLWNPS
jgi:hypothetical protein